MSKLMLFSAGKLLATPGGKPTTDQNCCCEQCPGCCLPTGTKSGVPCRDLCPGDPGFPTLFMDVTISGTGFGNITVTNVPINTTSNTGTTLCLGAHMGRSGGSTFIGLDSPFVLGDTTWDCTASKAVLAAAGCNADVGDCDWTFGFSAKCERDGSNNFTGHYVVSFNYIFDQTFEYDYAPYTTDPTSLVKCWSKDRAVDITFTETKPSTSATCFFLTGPTKTFIVRIHS